MNEFFLNKEMRDKLMTLSTLMRYNNSFHIRTESVAEHSFYVGIFTMEICELLGVGPNVTSLAIRTALIHDVHEAELSDIPHNVKTEFAQIRKICSLFEERFNEEHFPEIKEEMDIICPVQQALVKLIVDIADVIDVLQFADHEIAIGNKSFYQIRSSAEKRINDDLFELNLIYDNDKVRMLKGEIFKVCLPMDEK